MTPEPPRLHIGGDLDAATAPHEFLRIVDEIPKSAATLELDLSAVEFIDSSGLAMLIRAKSYFDDVGGELVLTNPSPSVTRLMCMTGMTDTFAFRIDDSPPDRAPA